MGGGAVPLSRFLCFPRSAASPPSFALRAKDNQAERRQRDEKETEKEREEIYVTGAFFRATTLTAYKMFTKHLCVRVSRTHADRVDFSTSNNTFRPAREMNANEERDAPMTSAKYQGNISGFR